MQHGKIAMALAATIWCLCTSAAHAADTKKDAPPPQLDEADRLTREGVAAGERGEWQKAHQLLSQAWDLKQAYDIAGNLAQVEGELNLWADAAEHLHYVKSHLPAFVKANVRARAERQYLEAMSKVFTLVIACNVEGATITVATRRHEPTPLTTPVFLMPGTHELEASSDGYRTNRITINAQAGLKQDLTIELQREPDTTPLSSGPDAKLIAGIASGAAAAVAFGIGVGGAVIADNRNADVTEQQAIVDAAGGCAAPNPPVACMALLDAAQAHDTALNVSDGGFIAGGILAASSVGLLLWSALDPDTKDVQAAPVISSNSVSLSLIGTW